MLSRVYGGEAVKKSRVFEWHKWFKEGRDYVENDERMVIQDLTEAIKVMKKCGTWYMQTF
jgi:hypothetical protein